ncbi:MAG: ABC transporter ATP-binding protein [Mesorhizobium sp.]|uniref:ABC transporter ATP-binding protein n=1 Tax=Mesorhizobium sp. TaxID=1871066 RepID=UPI001AC42472|nr:ABC transporter ATP-binding protein [Mesorhizobium sp.]MBN9218128.1 ABC transporter ATP-binding protein [Mesorhizobium sp.]
MTSNATPDAIPVEGHPGRGSVSLRDVEIRFGEFTAVHRTNLHIESGEFFSFLGPSGCGKTTLLRAISGFLQPTSGQVSIGGVDVRRKGPNARPTALVFQNLALFPLMSVAENIGYGLRVRGVARHARQTTVERLLDLVSLPGQGGKKIHELSGGQKQRVAIARALAVEPSVLLLDEPLSALDLKLRQHMRAELRAIQRRIGITFVYITHDQGEALAMSDRVAVMNAGRIEQVGTARGVYDAPETPFVASFVGENNIVHGRVKEVHDNQAVLETPLGDLTGRRTGSLRPGQEAAFFIRPESIQIQPSASALAAEIVEISYEGSTSQITLKMTNGETMLARVPTSRALNPAVGDQLGFGFGREEGTVIATDGVRP